MTRLRSTIAATLLAGVALIAPAAAHAAQPALLISVVDPVDGDLVVIEPAEDVVVIEPAEDLVVIAPAEDLVVADLDEQRISLLGWGWGG